MAAAANSLTPLGPGTVHVVIDMQRMFAEATEWRVPTLGDVVPAILALARAHRSATVFTRFVTPKEPDAASGQWRQYYARWRSMVLDRMDGAMLDLVEPLRTLAGAADIFDKTTYSAFGGAGFAAALTRRQARSLVLTGVETDVCVLATALDAVDRGFRVVIAADGVTGAAPAGHRATLDAVLPRFDQQVQVARVDEILAAWPPD